jgi:prophage tail gpP-like protein
MTEISLTIGSQRFTGWEEVDVKIGLEQCAGTFELRCADRWAIAGQTTPMLEGMPCSIQIAGKTVITGYIDDSNPSYSADDHNLTIIGRDAAQDLVDCAAVTDGFGVLNQNLIQIARGLCKPFGIAVSVSPGVSTGGAFQFSRINVGETCLEALQRLSQIRGVLVMSDSQGGIVFTQAGASRARTQLELGRNIESCDATHSVKDRFHKYLVYSQTFEVDNPSVAQQVIGSAVDPDSRIRKGRVTIVDPVEPSDIYMASKLAQWVANTRRAQGDRAQYKVKGWLDIDQPWAANTIISINDPWGRFQGDYLICGVNFKIDEQAGEVALLDVVPRGAYSTLTHKESPDEIYSLLHIPAGTGE